MGQINAGNEKFQTQEQIRADADFDRRYKPVGIAAVSAAAICNREKKTKSS